MLDALTDDIARGDLTRGQIGHAMQALLDPAVDAQAKASFLRAWAQRGETSGELAACAEVLLPLAVDPGLHGAWHGRPLLDCCGTGGGGVPLLNISTGIVFILAALGIPVVKHGNRGVTRRSGSADVLEALGVRIDLPPDRVGDCLKEVGAAFLYAPACHPSFAVLAPVRKQLAAEGRRTVFNLLGPLLNPARPEARLVGVFSPTHAELYASALRDFGCTRFAVACGEDAPSGTRIGEVSASGPTLLVVLRPGDHEITRLVLPGPSAPAAPLESLLVRDAAESAQRLLALLQRRENGLARDTLVLNAAVAAWLHGTASTIDEGTALAAEALDSGRALEVLHHWQRFSQHP